MVRISAHGVVYDLQHSPFFYERNGMLFRFSSEMHLNKFMSKVRSKEEWLSDSLSRRFHVEVDASIMADLQLYYQVETRGCSIQLEDGGEITCQEEEIAINCQIDKLNF